MSKALRDRFSLAKIQKKLKMLGYEPGEIDGYFGGKTSAAIAAYQKDNYLEVTGKPTVELQRML